MGRHSAPDDDEDDVDVAASPAPGTRSATATRPKPGRHSQAGEEPDGGSDEGSDGGYDGGSDGGEPEPAEPPNEGLALIEDALVEPAPVETDVESDVEQTAKIAPITDPVLDQPVPDADTDRYVPVGGTDGGSADATLAGPQPAADGDARPRPAPPKAKGKAGRSSTSDWALLRGHSDVRARCLAAAIVPVLAYLVIMLVSGAAVTRMLVWAFVPLVTAGVLIGLFLDAGHKKYDALSGSPDRP